MCSHADLESFSFRREMMTREWQVVLKNWKVQRRWYSESRLLHFAAVALICFRYTIFLLVHTFACRSPTFLVSYTNWSMGCETENKENTRVKDHPHTTFSAQNTRSDIVRRRQEPFLHNLRSIGLRATVLKRFCCCCGHSQFVRKNEHVHSQMLKSQNFCTLQRWRTFV